MKKLICSLFLAAAALPAQSDPTLILYAGPPAGQQTTNQNFVYMYNQPDGIAHFSEIYFMVRPVGEYPWSGQANTCYVASAYGNWYLMNDAGTAWSYTPIGQPGSISNSQCTINGFQSNYGPDSSDPAHHIIVNMNVTRTGAYASALLGVWGAAQAVGRPAIPWANNGTWGAIQRTVSIVNTTRGGSNFFYGGDRYHIEAHGAAYAAVHRNFTLQNGCVQCQNDVTAPLDATGKWAYDGVVAETEIGAWTETWVETGSNIALTPTLQFTVKGKGSQMQLVSETPPTQGYNNYPFQTSSVPGPTPSPYLNVKHGRKSAGTVAADIAVESEPSGDGTLWRFKIQADAGVNYVSIGLADHWPLMDKRAKSTESPDGWRFNGGGWMLPHGKKQNGEFTLAAQSSMLPGPVLVTLWDGGDSRVSLIAPTRQWVIGPSLQAGISADELRQLAYRWNESGLDFVRPLIDAKDVFAAVRELQPKDDFERQVLQCLRDATESR